MQPDTRVGSGLNFTYNPHRLLLNKVTDVYLVKDGQRVELQDDKLYRIVADPVSYTHLTSGHHPPRNGPRAARP